MYKLKIIKGKNNTIQFEEKRMKAYDECVIPTTIEECSFGKEIEDESVLALGLYDEIKLIGGMILSYNNKNIFIERIFVDEERRNKGIGSIMIKSLIKYKRILENYFADEITGIIAEPTSKSINFYYKNSFDYSGYQMYKKYK